MMEWTREGVEMNLAGPAIQVRGHHVEVAEVHHSPGAHNANPGIRPQTAQVEGQPHEAQRLQAAQLIGQAKSIAPVQAAASAEEAVVGVDAADEIDAQSK
jgi:hypothetical protein